MNKEEYDKIVEKLDTTDIDEDFWLEYQIAVNKIINENIEKDKEIDIMKKYFQMIIDLGYDYDGFNNVKDLKGLIDVLCKYASLGKECNTTEIIYVNGNKKYNILDEELKEGKSKENTKYRGEITYDEIKGCLNNQDLFDYGDN